MLDEHAVTFFFFFFQSHLKLWLLHVRLDGLTPQTTILFNTPHHHKALTVTVFFQK